MATVIGVPKEIKDMEGRVSMQPDGVAELVHHGHEVVVQAGAGGGPASPTGSTKTQARGSSTGPRRCSRRRT